VASIKIAYIGGASSRAPGTMASFIEQGQNFAGSEIVLVDLNQERLDLVQALATRMAQSRNADLTITATTDRKAALDGCDAVLSSFRPGGFEARYFDESIPLRHGVIGQETQGPGGFFMALRAIHVMTDLIREMEAICPNAWLFNYTNPVNIVLEAISHHSSIRAVSLCEGPMIFPEHTAAAADLDPALVSADMIGLNHGSWTVRHTYDGQDIIPLLGDAYERKSRDGSLDPGRLRLLRLAVEMESIPADYFQYYYYRDEILEELLARPTTRAQDIMAAVPDYWAHYREQLTADTPELDPNRSRGGINELELAIDVMDAVFNDRQEVWPVNVPNHGAIPGFPADRVVEVPGFVDRQGIRPLPQPALPVHVSGLVQMLGEYQAATADAAWRGGRREAVRALASNPLVLSYTRAERLYDEMAAAHRAWLPDRLLGN